MAGTAPIDPRLTGEVQPGAQLPVTLPTRVFEDRDGASDGDGNEGSEKRRKLNLWKCRQCRDARKKVRRSFDCLLRSWSFEFGMRESTYPFQPTKLDEVEYEVIDR